MKGKNIFKGINLSLMWRSSNYSANREKKIILVLLITASIPCNGQTYMTPKEGFYFIMKVNQEKITEDAIKNEDNKGLTMRWFDYYIHMFDQANYNRVVNDEFKWPAYSKGISGEIQSGISKADFNKVYIVDGTAELGKYDHGAGGFPFKYLDLDDILTCDDHISFKICIGLGSVFNLIDFNMMLKLDPARAERLVEQIGENRNVGVRLFYNVVNRKENNRWDTKYIGIYCHKIVLFSGTEVLGEVKPITDYYDKANLVHKANGYSKQFYNDKGNRLHQKDSLNAAYYRIFKFKNGSVESPVVDYYKNGTIKVSAYCDQYGYYYNGEVTWYDENGNKKARGTFINGSKNGIYTEWYPNGQKSSEVNYLNDNKHGCHYEWKEDGTPNSYSKYALYFENGQLKDGTSTKCLFANYKPEANIQKSSEENEVKTENVKSANTAIVSNTTNHLGYFNNEASLGDYRNIRQGKSVQPLFYKSIWFKPIKIQIAAAKFTNSAYQYEKIVISPGENFILTLETTGIAFYRAGSTGASKANYSLAIQIQDSSGHEYYKVVKNRNTFIKEDESKYTLPIKIEFLAEELGAMNLPLSSPLFLSFLINDNGEKDRIVQGFVEFSIE